MGLSGILSAASHYFLFLPVVSLNTRRVYSDARANGETKVWHAVAAEHVQHNKVLKMCFLIPDARHLPIKVRGVPSLILLAKHE